ncbi:MAG: hypothetical protein ABDH49_01465 [Candidatus Hydrothermales bacterium]
MKKLIISLPFLIYYCIAPLNHDKAAINKGANYYLGAEGVYAQGKYTEAGCGYTAIRDFEYYGLTATGGAYYGFSKNIAIGAEASLASGLFISEGERAIASLYNSSYAFLKFAFLFPFGILAFKPGVSFPQIFKIGVLLGIPNPEKFTLSYFWAYPQFNTLSINILVRENLALSTGFSSIRFNGEDHSTNFHLGITFIRK